MNCLPWIGELEINRFGRMAITGDLADVGFEHVWKAVKSAFAEDVVIELVGCGGVVDVAFLGSTGHSDGSTVHVHLPVADFVEPGPRERVASGLNIFGDGELELRCAGPVRVTAYVPGSGGRASSLDGEDNLERRFFGRCEVFRQSNLTASTTVGRRSGKGECLRAADRHDILACRRAVHTGTLLTWVVAPRSIQGAIVEAAWSKRAGRFHDHMGRNAGCKTQEASNERF